MLLLPSNYRWETDFLFLSTPKLEGEICFLRLLTDLRVHPSQVTDDTFL